MQTSISRIVQIDLDLDKLTKAFGTEAAHEWARIKNRLFTDGFNEAKEALEGAYHDISRGVEVGADVIVEGITDVAEEVVEGAKEVGKIADIVANKIEEVEVKFTEKAA